MQVLWKVAVFVAATVAVIFVIPWSIHSVGFGSLITALVLNWLLVCWIASASRIFPLSLSLAYYRIKAFEGGGQVYERLGIRLVRKFLRRGPLRILSPKLRLSNRVTLDTLWDLECEMRCAETIHVLAFALATSIGVYAGIRSGLGAVWILLVNIVINLYPIMLQRYNRIKLDGVKHKQQARGRLALA